MKEKNKKISLLNLMIQRGLAVNEDQARGLIMAGQVIVDDQRVDKPGKLISSLAQLRVKGQNPYVSRGGAKLAGAVADLGLASEFNNSVVLDVGASTGGFTDCSLQLGARYVYAVDVGTNQLAWKLRNHPRIKSMEKTDIRTFESCIDSEISIVVADVSFTSLSNVLPSILRASPKSGVRYLLLIKPQFELDPSLVPVGGIVADEGLRQLAVNHVIATLAHLRFLNPTVIESKVAGRNGNKEVFIFFQN